MQRRNKMKISMKVRNKVTQMEWAEEYDIKDGSDAEQYAIDLIDNFNNTLRPNEAPRELVYVEILEDTSQSKVAHNWEKQNAYTVVGKHSVHDVYRCSACGITGKRFGLSADVVRDNQYKATKYEYCSGKSK
jgi:hypothetical protein